MGRAGLRSKRLLNVLPWRTVLELRAQGWCIAAARPRAGGTYTLFARAMHAHAHEQRVAARGCLPCVHTHAHTLTLSRTHTRAGNHTCTHACAQVLAGSRDDLGASGPGPGALWRACRAKEEYANELVWCHSSVGLARQHGDASLLVHLAAIHIGLNYIAMTV